MARRRLCAYAAHGGGEELRGLNVDQVEGTGRRELAEERQRPRQRHEGLQP